MTIFVSEPVLLDEYGRKTLAYPDTDTGERPIFYCYAGPNGAGKTTFMKEHVDSRIPVIRPDQMVKEENIKDNFTLSELVRERMENLFAQRVSFAFEHNLHTSTAYRYFDLARERGYATTLVYLGINDVKICIKRVNERVAKGTGHAVPEAVIRQRYTDSLFHLKTNSQRVDRIIVVDNTDFQQPTHVLTFENGMLSKEISELPPWVATTFANQLRIVERLAARKKSGA